MSMTMEWDLGQFEQIDKEFEYLKNHSIKVGVIGEENIGGVSVQDYAVWNEYGTIYIPSRPFFRKALASRRAQREITELMQSLLNRVIQEGMTGEQMLRTIGEYCKARLVESINSGGWQENKGKKKKKKNQSKPLVDTGTLIGAFDFEII